MVVSSIPKSIHELPPIETGGTSARQGFVFQDHVAAGYCISMLSEPRLLQVWCETQDDITLIWKGAEEPSSEEVEFVQVKSNELDQLWSIALLCQQDNKAASATSILEKSLQYDRCTEPCRFRIVTLRPPNKDLEILTHNHASPTRCCIPNPLQALNAEAKKRLVTFTSPNGHDCSFWLAFATWETKHDLSSVRNANLLALARILAKEGLYLAPDQSDEVYLKILAKVQQAADEDGYACPATKKIPQDDMRSWLRRIANDVAHPAANGTGKALRRKMAAAGIPDDSIQAAIEHRVSFRREILQQRYLTSNDLHLLEGEVSAKLLHLKSQLDAESFQDTGIQFHERCLSAIGNLQNSLGTVNKPPLAFIQGCMYDMADRCVHRFTKVTA
jgi:hypothetical protein